MKNRKLLLIVSIVLALTMSLGGTLAYLTDTDEAVNVMTLGNVDIELHEQQRNADGSALEPFSDGPLYPVYLKNGKFEGEYETLEGYDYSYKFFNSEYVTGAKDKIVTVENVGSSPAYVRTVFAFEAPMDKVHLLRNVTPGESTMGNTDWEWKWIGDDREPDITIDGVQYCLAVATSTKALNPGETTIPALTQIALDASATNEDMAAFGQNYLIYVVSQAVQTTNLDGLGDPGAALDVAFGAIAVDDPTTADVDEENHPWVDYPRGAEGTVYMTKEDLTQNATGTYGFDYNQTELNATKTFVFENGVYDGPFFSQGISEDVTIDGNGATFNGKFELNMGYVKEAGTLTIKDLNVEGDLVIQSFLQDVVISNVSAKSIQITNNDGNTVTIENCTVNGNGTNKDGNGKYGVYMTTKDATKTVTLNVKNSTFTNIPGHVISIQGIDTNSDQRGDAKFAFNITGNTFDEWGLAYVDGDDRAAFKIWLDDTYAPDETATDITPEAMTLGDELWQNNTFNIDGNEVVAQFFGNSYFPNQQ